MRTARLLPYGGISLTETPRTETSLPGQETPLVMWPVMHAGTETLPAPPVDRQTPVKTLPCPKLRLRAVVTDNLQKTCEIMTNRCVTAGIITILQMLSIHAEVIHSQQVRNHDLGKGWVKCCRAKFVNMADKLIKIHLWGHWNPLRTSGDVCPIFTSLGTHSVYMHMCQCSINGGQ